MSQGGGSGGHTAAAADGAGGGADAAALRHKLAVLTKAFKGLREEKAAAEAHVAALEEELRRLKGGETHGQGGHEDAGDGLQPPEGPEAGPG